MFPGDIDLEVGAFKTECKQEDDPDFLLVGDEEPLDLFNYFKDEFLLNNALQPFELNDCCAQVLNGLKAAVGLQLLTSLTVSFYCEKVTKESKDLTRLQ